MPLKKVADEFMQKDMKDEPEKIKDLVRHYINLESNVDGLELSEISLRAYSMD